MAVLAALLLLLWPREKPAAAITVRALESPVKMMQDTDVFAGDGRGWMFTFEIVNESDVPFTPELAIVNIYEGAALDSKLQMTYEDMRPWMDRDQLHRGDTPIQLLFGTNHTRTDHAECILSGRDANGHGLTCRCTVEFSQEMQE